MAHEKKKLVVSDRKRLDPQVQEVSKLTEYQPKHLMEISENTLNFNEFLRDGDS